MAYALLVAALTCNALANFFLKLGSLRLGAISSVTISSLLSNSPLMAGLMLFGLNVILYTVALARIPLSIGYPVMVVGTLCFVTLLSFLVLGEPLRLTHVVGLGLLLTGVVFLFIPISI